MCRCPILSVARLPGRKPHWSRHGAADAYSYFLGICRKLMASVSFFRGLCSEAEWASNYFPDYLSQVTHGTCLFT